MEIPKQIYSGEWSEGHVQGIAVDAEKGFIYYSFTTLLVKTDFSGNLIGSVKRLAGHLGCITFDADRRRVYGSLELKHDAIGKGIINRTGWDPTAEDAFYLVSFDCDKITRPEMDAETDGVMDAVWLREVVSDYASTDEVSGCAHRLGCSGIDGAGYGPAFGADGDSAKKIMVCYGVYSEIERADNDHQVILQYDPSVFAEFGKPLTQEAPHHSGPVLPEKKYYFFTGNTRYGVQNLEYDAFTRSWIVAVYHGEKPQYANFDTYFIDAGKAPAESPLAGRGGERGLLLSGAELGEKAPEGTRGIRFRYGQTGVFAFGDGTYYFSVDGGNRERRVCDSTATLYRFDNTDPHLFREV